MSVLDAVTDGSAGPEKTFNHLEFKRDAPFGWLVYCPARKCWAVANHPDGYRCAGCGTDLTDRIKAAA